MATQLVKAAGMQIPVEVLTPTGQLSTGSYVVLAGSELDARGFKSLAYTVVMAAQSVFWKIFGANSSDFSDEVEVLAETSVAAGAAGSYTATPPPFAYYRAKIKSNSGAGTATLRAIAKR